MILYYPIPKVIPYFLYANFGSRRSGDITSYVLILYMKLLLSNKAKRNPVDESTGN